MVLKVKSIYISILALVVAAFSSLASAQVTVTLYHPDIRGTASFATGSYFLTSDVYERSQHHSAFGHTELGDALAIGNPSQRKLGELTPLTAGGSYEQDILSGNNQAVILDDLDYLGEVRDSDGLLYLKGRYYDPFYGFFLTPDPAGFVESNTNTLNPYMYSGNDPISSSDKSGMYLETAWDIFNISLGVSSLSSNFAAGDYSAAAVDLAGIAFDGLAAILPGVPGGVGASLAATGKIAADVPQVRLNYAAGKAYQNSVFERVMSHDKVSSAVQEITLLTNQTAVRFRIDIAITTKDGRFLLYEAKSSKFARFTKPQLNGLPDLVKFGGEVRGLGKGDYYGGRLFDPGDIEWYRVDPDLGGFLPGLD